MREGLSKVGAVFGKRHRDWIRLRMFEYSMETCCFQSFLDESGIGRRLCGDVGHDVGVAGGTGSSSSSSR